MIIPSQSKESRVLRMGSDHLLVSKCPHGNKGIWRDIANVIVKLWSSKDFRARVLQCSVQPCTDKIPGTKTVSGQCLQVKVTSA